MDNIQGIYRGRVENVKDPTLTGKVKVRIPYLHGVPNNEIAYVPVDSLPWATPLVHGIAGQDFGTFIVPPVGSYVFVMFEDGNAERPVYIGSSYGEGSTYPKKMNTFDVEGDKDIDMGEWYTEVGRIETPTDVFEGKGSYYPSRGVIFKSQKGHTIVYDDTDGEESFSIIDRLGQMIKLSGSMSVEDNKGNVSKRGNKRADKGSQLGDDSAFIEVISKNSYMKVSPKEIKFSSDKIILNSDDVIIPTSSYTAEDILTKIKTVDGAGSGLDADLLDGKHLTDLATAAQGIKADSALPASSYTAADVLTKIKTVDGSGSLLDADMVDGYNSSAFATAAQGTKADTAVQSVKINGGTELKSGVNVNLPAYPTTLPASDVSAWAKAGTKPTYTPTEVGAATSAQGTKADAALPSASYTAADVLAKIKTVDGTGSLLDADTLDGIQASSFATQIGGRNLLTNANTINLSTSDYPANTTRVLGSITVLNANMFNAYGWAQSIFSVPIANLCSKIGTKYTFGVDIRTTSLTTTGLIFTGDFRTGTTDSISISTGAILPNLNGFWQRVYCTVQIGATTDTQSLLVITSGSSTGFSGVVIEYKNLKLESGDKGSDWSPAPEDMVANASYTAADVLSKVNTLLDSTHRWWTDALNTILGSKATSSITLAGYGITDASPLSHVGSNGAAHADVTTSVDGFMIAADKSKLDGIAASANNYIHPANHPPSIITQDASNRFATDAEKTAWNAKQAALGFTPENIANKGSNNGYAGLDAGGKVVLANLPATLLIYKGVWNATTNTPTLIATDLTKVGFVYNVSVVGTQFGIAFKLGDWAIYNDLGVIEKSDNSDDVVTVNGQQGAVVLTPDNLDDTSTAHKFVASGDVTKLGNLSNTNSGDETLNTIKTKLGIITLSGSNTGDQTLTGLPYATTAQGTKADNALPSASYTAADILTKIKTVDGAGNGLDADLLDGLDSTAFATAAQGMLADNAVPNTRTVNTKALSADIVLTPDDLSDGATAHKFVALGDLTHLANLSGSNTGDQTLTGLPYATTAQGTKADAALPSASYTAADVLAKLLTVDGPGKGIDADYLDSVQASGFLLKPILITTGQDFNSLTTPGMYYCPADVAAASLLNRPTSTAFSLLVEMHAGYKQTVTEYTLTNPLTWTRNYYSGTWGSWRRMWDAGSDGAGSGLDANLLDGRPSTDLVPAGMTGTFARNTAPTGWLKANGALVSRTVYEVLFAAIGTVWGVGDGSTTFSLPDLRGDFIRCWNDDGSNDTGRAFASYQADQNENHSHTASGSSGSNSADHTHTGTSGGRSVVHTHTGTSGVNSVDHTHTASSGVNSVAHTHSGTSASENLNHYHSGTTDVAGTHSHAAKIWAVTGGAQAGGISSYGSDRGGSGYGMDPAPNHSHTFDTGNMSGSHQHTFTSGNEVVTHTHTITNNNNSADHTHTTTTGSESADHTHTTTTGNNSADHSHTVTVTVNTSTDGGTETRVKNIALLACIKY